MASKPDTKYLQQRGDLWLFHWRVPSDCRDAFDGKAFFVKSLETHSLRTAQRRRQQVLAECLRVVDEARAAGTNDVRALFRTKLKGVQKASPEDLEAAYFHHIDKEPTSPAEEALREALRVEYHGHNSELAKCSLKDALRLYLEEKDGQLKRNTITSAKKAVETFLAHLKKADTALTSITRQDVRGFIKASAIASKTMGTRLSFLSTMFQIAQDHGELDAGAPNPFTKHRLASGDTQSYQPFTRKELRKIMDATESYRESTKDYHKFMLPRLAYATGCRLEELASLQRAQIREEGEIVYIAIAEGVDSYKGKTLNAGRRLPVHTSLAGELLRWRDSDDHRLLFPALESNRADGKLGDKFGKWFGRLKKQLGVTGGRHKAFHSFRVHMATNLEQAEVPESRAVWILGHTRNLSLSYGLYSKGPSLEQLREDAESAVGYGLREELGGAW